MKITSFGSSSAGNSYLIDDGKSVLMIECGFAYKTLVGMMREKGYSFSQLSGVLISHEHKDHARCWDKLADYGLSVYASDGTIERLGEDDWDKARLLRPLAPAPGHDVSAPAAIGSFDVIAFRTFHDAAEPIGFLIQSQETGEKLVFATDTVNIRYQFPGVNILMLEANYAESILARNSRIPDTVVKRIRNSHMELYRLADYLQTLDLGDCREIYLMHLSDAGSDEYMFYHSIRSVVPDHVKVWIFPKGGPKKGRK